MYIANWAIPNVGKTSAISAIAPGVRRRTEQLDMLRRLSPASAARTVGGKSQPYDQHQPMAGSSAHGHSLALAVALIQTPHRAAITYRGMALIGKGIGQDPDKGSKTLAQESEGLANSRAREY